jgi:hypothetical protein
MALARSTFTLVKLNETPRLSPNVPMSHSGGELTYIETGGTDFCDYMGCSLA